MKDITILAVMIAMLTVLGAMIFADWLRRSIEEYEKDE